MAKGKKATKSKSWKNRIVGHAEVDPRSITEHPDNYRIHSALQANSLKGTIDDVGFLRSVTVNKRTGHLVDGHLRVALAIKAHQATVPVEYIDVSQAEELKILATIDPIAAMATADADKIDALVGKMDPGDQAAEILKAMAAPGSEPATEETEETDTTTIQFKKGTMIKIGTYRFPVPKKKYTKWIETLKQKHGFSDEEVIAELKRRLGIAG
jgi:hypothetical protein